MNSFSWRKGHDMKTPTPGFNASDNGGRFPLMERSGNLSETRQIWPETAGNRPEKDEMRRQGAGGGRRPSGKFCI